LSISLKERIKAAKPVLHPITFCGVECFVRRWSERERIEWAVHIQTAGEGEAADKLVRARAIAWSLCDDAGELVFGPDGVDDVAALCEDLGPTFDAVIAIQKNAKDDPKKN